jgi:hypothetical protein
MASSWIDALRIKNKKNNTGNSFMSFRRVQINDIFSQNKCEILVISVENSLILNENTPDL